MIMTILLIKKITQQLNKLNVKTILSLVELPVIKVAVLVLSMILFPTYAKMMERNEQSFASQIKFDSSKSHPLYLDKQEIKFTIAESNYNVEQKKKVAQKSRNVIAREGRSYSHDVSFEQKRELAKKAAQSAGIDWKILEAVWEVESGKSWDTSIHSYAGAQGPMQFLPSTFRKYATDGNGDEQTDITKAEDALYSAAKLLASSGAASGNIDKALFSYNHAQWYVNKVKKVADSIVE